MRKRSKTKVEGVGDDDRERRYWTNALSQPQKSHSSVGTMKNGTKSGPTSAQTALATRLNETTNRSADLLREGR